MDLKSEISVDVQNWHELAKDNNIFQKHSYINWKYLKIYIFLFYSLAVYYGLNNYYNTKINYNC